MNTIEFQENNGKTVRKAEIPASWDEMTAAQVCFVFKTYETYIQGEISPLQMNIAILFNLLGLKFRPNKKIAESSEACQNIFILCEQTLGFLFDTEGDGPVRLTFDSVQNPLPLARYGAARTALAGPATLLQDLTFGEFRNASAALNTFFQSSNIEDLDECIAWLYRRIAMRPNRAGRRVKAFTSEDIRRASRIEGWQKNLIMLWFSACINYLQTGSVKLNGEDVDLALMFRGDDKGGPSFTWNDLLLHLAKEQCIGNMDRVDEEPLFSILSIMWSNYKDGKRYEQSIKSAKS